MLETAALIVWLLTIFSLACFAATISVQNKYELRDVKRELEKRTFVPLADDSATEEEAKKLNAMLAGYEDEQLGELSHVSESVFRQGPIL